jgi:hypothetical protein
LQAKRLLKMAANHTRLPRRAETHLFPSKAAGEKKPEAYPLGYVEDFFELRTKLGAIFSSLRY